MNIINPFAKDQLSVTTDLAGQPLTLAVNQLAFRATAAVVVTWGETVVLVTTVINNDQSPLDYMPLSVEYEERFYAAGKISGSRYIKREGRPSDEAILTGRLIDRPIRPLFPKGYRHEVQIVATVLSLDPNNQPDTPAMIGASASLLLSGAPFAGPVAGIRVGLDQNNQPLVGLSADQRQTNKLDLMVASNSNGVVMVEAAAAEVSETDVAAAIKAANQANQAGLDIQNQLKEKVGGQQQPYSLVEPAAEIKQTVSEWWSNQPDSLTDTSGDYGQRRDKLETLKTHFQDEFAAKVGADWDDQKPDYDQVLEKLIDDQIRTDIIDHRKRPDNRRLDEVRPLSSQVGVLPRTHGSAIFTRGATQALNVVTLAPLSQSQAIDTMTTNDEKRYFHHYNAPGYTIGEVRRIGSPGRREIGHSYLAERALLAVLPDRQKFPYAIRSVSEIMSQHGSTSMAATCSSCLALMDAGVPLTAPVAGIAMGLIMTPDGEPIILTDIQDAEDFAGDMDFKVAGTASGITAIQMDMKVPGVQPEILETALMVANQGRQQILEHMATVLDGPRPELNQYAPQVDSLMIAVEKIKDVIGKGGETIQGIVAATGAQIDIEDDGQVLIFSPNRESLKAARDRIKELTAEPEVGKIYRQRPVVKVADFGAFVNIIPGRDGMVHVSEISHQRVNNPSDYLKVNDLVDVKLLAIDDRGRLSLSIRRAQKKK